MNGQGNVGVVKGQGWLVIIAKGERKPFANAYLVWA
jgi:hypothetical protein